jgi:hypothetical protein
MSPTQKGAAVGRALVPTLIEACEPMNKQQREEFLGGFLALLSGASHALIGFSATQALLDDAKDVAEAGARLIAQGAH